jgi:Uncharacterized alpha/beta hydrolase domain (DUF2235)
MSFEPQREWYAKCKKCHANLATHVDPAPFKNNEKAYRATEAGVPHTLPNSQVHAGNCPVCHGAPTDWSDRVKPTGKIHQVGSVQKAEPPASKAKERLQRQETKPSDLSAKPTAALPCCINLTVNFFFDGTGNNMKTDEGTQETSNITRLFLAHELDNDLTSTYAFYVPGIGTLFPDIGDPGVNKTDDDTLAWTAKITSGIGGMGQPRLDFAEKKIDEKVAAIPADKLKSVRLAVFGFSRGAALARAFATQLHKNRCQLVGAQWKFKTKSGQLVDFEIYFMGLYDCVASAGLPASARKYASDVLKYGMPASGVLMPLLGPLGPLGVIFARKKAAKASGHDGWAKDMRVPPSVKICVHYYSVHETRNAFPVDSLLVGTSMPATGTQFEELGYYGVHSNVGGGYRPGENGRSMHVNMQLSNLPLNWMYEKAKKSNVPFYPYKKMVRKVRDTFEVASGLEESFKQYQGRTRSAEKTPHEMMLHHMRPYIQWRSYRFHRGIAKFNADTATEMEAQARKEQAEYEKQIAAIDERVANNIYESQRLMNSRTPAAFKLLDQLRQERETLEGKRVEWTNRIATLPTHHTQKEIKEGKATERSSKYWEMWETKQKELKAQVDLLKLNKKDGMPLLKYHEMIIEAWDESLDSVKDEAIYTFFDNFVHDSASDFNSDRSLLIDPRMVFVGGDNTALDPEIKELIEKREAAQKVKEQKVRDLYNEQHANDPTYII